MISLFKTSTIKILKSASLWISLIFLVFFISFVPGSFKDVNSVFTNEITEADIILKSQIIGSIIITGLIIIIVTTFSESFVKIKSSLIYKNYQLSDKSIIQFYIATILPIVIYSIIYLIIAFSLVGIFDQFGIIKGFKYTYIKKSILNWKNINYLMLIFSIFSSILLSVSIAIFISLFVKKTNTYISITWAYLFLIFFFGGSSVPLFLIRGDNALSAFTYISYCIPNVWSNFLFINSFSGQINLSQTIQILDLILPIIISILLILIGFSVKHFIKF